MTFVSQALVTTAVREVEKLGIKLLREVGYPSALSSSDYEDGDVKSD